VKKQIFCPYRIKKIGQYVTGQKPIILDVGCGNNSPSITKHWLKDCIYHGIDQSAENLNSEDQNNSDDFFELNLDIGNLSSVQDDYYDAIIMSHVVEHLENGELVLKELTKKLKVGGVFYLEFPSIRSLYLPHGSGTLNFYDDKTHIKFYSLGEVGNILLDSKMVVMEAGRKREWLKVLLSPAFLPLQVYSLLKDRRLHARGLWDVLGFSDYIVAKKPAQK
jgi:ubiquinone/menaquinone biosynthesis C-methylase UbiE